MEREIEVKPSIEVIDSVDAGIRGVVVAVSCANRRSLHFGD